MSTPAHLATLLVLCSPLVAAADDLKQRIDEDYAAHLAPLFEHFHRNPELSLAEHATAARVAAELRAVGFKVTEGVGGTGVVALLENGAGPLVMMRADMDGLPVKEQSGLPYASTATQADPTTGEIVPVMHACGHDAHITSLVGTARQMARIKDRWHGTLMLVAQPAEERLAGARAMLADDLWPRFGRPDYVLGFHVAADTAAGLINVQEASTYAGADSVDILVHGIGAHGASPHRGKDPIVLAAQIALALQTLVSREISPREPAVITIGKLEAGTKRNIISDEARLELTVRNTNLETRKLLLDGIERIAENMGRVAGLPEDLLPEVTILDEWAPPLLNDAKLVQRLKSAWSSGMGNERIVDQPSTGMGAEDFSFYMLDPVIPAAFWRIGGTAAEDIEKAAAGGAELPSHHSPLFKILPEPAITAGVESTVVALLELLR